MIWRKKQKRREMSRWRTRSRKLLFSNMAQGGDYRKSEEEEDTTEGIDWTRTYWRRTPGTVAAKRLVVRQRCSLLASTRWRHSGMRCSCRRSSAQCYIPHAETNHKKSSGTINLSVKTKRRSISRERTKTNNLPKRQPESYS